ncbi:MAG: hypothetical protein RL095_1986 [Verrucomicrobiota bacterium]|jgi:hypothetical protein
MNSCLATALASLLLASCGSLAPVERDYAADAEFLSAHTELIELRSGEDRIAVAPAWQGRVMTSTCKGPSGRSHGWINYPLVAQGVLPEKLRPELERHIHAFGGEERFWIGPEGGPFSVFFAPGAEQVFAHWKTPALLDTEAFPVVARDQSSVSFRKEARLVNAAGTTLEMGIERRVTLLDEPATRQIIGEAPGIDCVAYESANTIANRGSQAWSRATGMPSIWLLGMMKPSAGTTVYIPFRPGPEAELGPKVIANYFGDIPAARLKVTERGVFFKGDGLSRGKIGIPAKRALPASGSYDSENGVLTLLICELPPGHQDADYVCSLWGKQEKPFAGDVINSYNDGEAVAGKGQLGPFYELESSSPALALAPGQSQTHRQTTLHLSGERAGLDAIARRILGVSLDEISGALP